MRMHGIARWVAGCCPRARCVGSVARAQRGGRGGPGRRRARHRPQPAQQPQRRERVLHAPDFHAIAVHGRFVFARIKYAVFEHWSGAKGRGGRRLSRRR